MENILKWVTLLKCQTPDKSSVDLIENVTIISSFHILINGKNTKEVQTMRNLWKERFAWLRFMDGIKEDNIYKIDIEACQLKTKEFSQSLEQIKKCEGSKILTWSITKSFENDLENVKKLFELIFIIIKSKMEKRHWDYVQRIIDWKFDFTSDYFNVHNLLLKNFIKFEFQILDIVELASTEEVIKKEIEAIQKKKSEFEFTIFESINCINCVKGLSKIGKNLRMLLKRLENLSHAEGSRCFIDEIVDAKHHLNEMIYTSKWIKNSQKKVEDISCFFNNEYKRSKSNAPTSFYTQFIDFWNNIVVKEANEASTISNLTFRCTFHFFTYYD